MEADKKKIAADCWKKGSEAMAREDWDYAILMFGKAVSLVPENLMYRQSLRGVEQRKYGNNKTGGRMAGMRLMKVRARLKKAKMQKNWQAVDRLAEEGLTVNPWEPHLNADLGHACRELGYNEVARFALEAAVANDPDNKEYNRTLARLLEERGEYADAITCWQKVYKLDSMDGEARSKITQLGASSVMHRGGYEGADSTREVRKSAYDLDRPSGSTIPEAVDGPGVSVEADLQHAIRKDESDPENYLKLAEHYKRERRLAEAAETLQRALEVSGGDPKVRELLEDVELEQLRRNLEHAKDAARADDADDQARKNAAALAKELLQRELEVLGSRVERYPQDTRLKFELAKRHMRVQKWPSAIKLLQQATTDPRLESQVLVALGECFINDNKPGLAKRQFEKAVPKIDQHDHPDLFKKAHYVLGRLCEKNGQLEEAENHYNDVLALDYDYRDTLERLEKVQGGGVTGSSSE